MIKTVKEINTETEEGALCIGLLARLTTEFDTDKQPDEVIELASKQIPNDLIHEKCGYCTHYDGEDCLALDPCRNKNCDDVCDCEFFETP